MLPTYTLPVCKDIYQTRFNRLAIRMKHSNTHTNIIKVENITFSCFVTHFQCFVIVDETTSIQNVT